MQRPVKVTGPAGRDGEGGLEPGPRVKRAGRALSAPRPRPHAAEESGSRGAGSPESSAQPGFGLHRPAVARTLASRYSRNPPASTSDHPPYSTARLIPHDPPAACPSFLLP